MTKSVLCRLYQKQSMTRIQMMISKTLRKKNVHTIDALSLIDLGVINRDHNGVAVDLTKKCKELDKETSEIRE